MVLVPNFIPSRFQAGGSYGPRLGVGRYQGYVPPAPAESVPTTVQPAPAPASPMAPAPQVQVGARTRDSDGSDGAPGSVADNNFGIDAGRDLGMSLGQFATNTINGLGVVGPLGLGTMGAALLASQITENPLSFGIYSGATGRSALADLAGLLGRSNDATPLSAELNADVAPATVDALLAAPVMDAGLIGGDGLGGPVGGAPSGPGDFGALDGTAQNF